MRKYIHSFIPSFSFTFLPLALFYQFNNCFNLFFLITAVIQSIKQISPLDPMSAVMPFVVVLIISLIKEAIEDYRKTQFDTTSNNSKSITYIHPSFTETKWKDMQVGDIVRITKNEIIPADVLVIKSSNDNGFCYLETTNLDGETALKPREAIAHSQRNISDESSIESVFNVDECNTTVQVDKPSMDIYNIEGAIVFANEHSHKVYFDIKNTLLRGGRLKNVCVVHR